MNDTVRVVTNWTELPCETVPTKANKQARLREPNPCRSPLLTTDNTQRCLSIDESKKGGETGKMKLEKLWTNKNTTLRFWFFRFERDWPLLLDYSKVAVGNWTTHITLRTQKYYEVSTGRSSKFNSLEVHPTRSVYQQGKIVNEEEIFFRTGNILRVLPIVVLPHKKCQSFARRNLPPTLPLTCPKENDTRKTDPPRIRSTLRNQRPKIPSWDESTTRAAKKLQGLIFQQRKRKENANNAYM